VKITTPRWTVGHAVAMLIVALVALTVRLYYVHTALVDHPLRGDTLQYFAYALNLVDHHVFSLATSDGPVLPDSFRDPGYSAFLALLVTAFGREQAFYLATLNVQAALSALTVVIYAVLTRRWLGIRAATVVGLGLAFWPHTITLAGYVLSETLMGFLVAAGLWLTQVATERRHWSLFAAAGLVLAMAALTNAIFAPIPLLFGAIYLVKAPASRRYWAIFTIAAFLPITAWSVRGSLLPEGQTAGDRVVMNLVQGSWPEYHDAWRLSLQGDSASAAIMAKMDSEYSRFHQDRLAGLSAMVARMSTQPMRYLAWYVKKPAELWGWQIGIGMGDIYVFPTYNSPLSGTGPLRWITDLLFFAAPLILLLSAVGVLTLLVKRNGHPPALWLMVTSVVMITAAFTALQCDARYSTPYRGMEWVLAAVAVSNLASVAKRSFRRGQSGL
jgi:4-amino-4-deoxy-L-arabinose transferase-like glycosyltransferase